MNRSRSTRFFFFLNIFTSHILLAKHFFLCTPSPEIEGAEEKIRRDLIAGWQPKLLFVLTKRRHIKLNTDESSHSPDVVSVNDEPHLQMTEILSIIPPTFNIP